MVDTPVRCTATGLYDEHPWILLATEPGRNRDVQALWQRRGCEVYVCEGPTAGHTCPLVEGGHCPVAEEATLVVNALPSGATTDRLLDALAAQLPDLPVIDVLA